MKIGVNEQHRIKQVHDITDASLVAIELDEKSDFYPFKNFTDARILCYCYKQTGSATSIYPYVPLDVIETIEQRELGLQAQVIELEFEKLLMGVDM